MQPVSPSRTRLPLVLSFAAGAFLVLVSCSSSTTDEENSPAPGLHAGTRASDVVEDSGPDLSDVEPTTRKAPDQADASSPQVNPEQLSVDGRSTGRHLPIDQQSSYVATDVEFLRDWWPHGPLIYFTDRRGEVALYRSRFDGDSDYAFVAMFLQVPPATVKNSNHKEFRLHGGATGGVFYIQPGGFGAISVLEKDAKKIVVRGRSAFLMEMYEEGDGPPRDERESWQQVRSNETKRTIWWRENLANGAMLRWDFYTHPRMYTEQEMLNLIEEMVVVT